jgi:peptidoglycan/LPS O-acetylase OafA/YrhL
VNPPQALRLPFDLFFALALSPLIVFLASTMEPPAAFRRPFALLGELSFPLYAIHVPVIAVGIVVTRRLHLPPIAGGVIVLACVIVAAWIADKADLRVRAILDRLSSGRRVARAQEARTVPPAQTGA